MYVNMWILDDFLTQGKPIIIKMFDSLLSFLKHQNCASIQIALLPDCRPRRNTSQINNLRYIYMVKSYGNILQNRFVIPNSKTYFNDVMWRYYSNYNRELNPRLDHYRKNKLKYPNLCKYCKRPGPPYKKRKPKSVFGWIWSVLGYEKKPKGKFKCCKAKCSGAEIKEAPKGEQTLSYQEKKNCPAKKNIKKTSKLTPSSSDVIDIKPTESSTEVHKKSHKTSKKSENGNLELKAKKLSELCVKYNLEDVWISDKASENVEKIKPMPSINKVPCIDQPLPCKVETTEKEQEVAGKDKKIEFSQSPEACSKGMGIPSKFDVKLCRTCGENETEPPIKIEREPLNLAATKDTKTRSVLAAIPELCKEPCKDSITDDSTESTCLEKSSDKINKPCVTQIQGDKINTYPPCISTEKPPFGDVINDIDECVRVEHPGKSSREICEQHETLTDQETQSDVKECKTILTCNLNVTECVAKATEKLCRKDDDNLDKEYKLSLVLSEHSIKRKGSSCELNDEESNAAQSKQFKKSLSEKESYEKMKPKSTKLNETESRNYIFPALGQEKTNKELFGIENLQPIKDKIATKNETELVMAENKKSTHEGVKIDVPGDTSHYSKTQEQGKEPLQPLLQRDTKTFQLLQPKSYNDKELTETSTIYKDKGLDEYTEVSHSDALSVKSEGKLDEKSTKVLQVLEQATFDKLKSNESPGTIRSLKEVLERAGPETKSLKYEATQIGNIEDSQPISKEISSYSQAKTSQPSQSNDFNDRKLNKTELLDDYEKDFHFEVSSSKGTRQLDEESMRQLDEESMRQLDEKSMKVLQSLEKEPTDNIKSNESEMSTGSWQMALDRASHKPKTPYYEAVQIGSISKQPQLTSQGESPQFQNIKNKFDEASVRHQSPQDSYDADSTKVEQLFFKVPAHRNKKISKEITSVFLKTQLKDGNLNNAELHERFELLIDESDHNDFSKQQGKQLESSNQFQDVNKYETDDSFMVQENRIVHEGYNTDCPEVIHPIHSASLPQSEEMKKSQEKIKSDKNVPLPLSNSVGNFQPKDVRNSEVKNLDGKIKSKNTVYSPIAKTKFSLPVPKIRNLETRKKRNQSQNNSASLFKDTFFLISEKNKKLKYQKFQRVDSEKQDLTALNNLANKVAKFGKTVKENTTGRIYFASSKMAAKNESTPVNKESKRNAQPKGENLINFVNRSYLKGYKRSKIEVPVTNKNYIVSQENKESVSMGSNSGELNDLKLLTFKTHEFCKIMLELVKMFSAYKLSTNAVIKNKTQENLELKQKKLQELKNTIKLLEENVQEFLQLSDAELKSKRSLSSKSKPKIQFYSYCDSEGGLNNQFGGSKPESSHCSSNCQESKLTITNYQPSTSSKNLREHENILPNVVSQSDEDEFRKTLLDLVLLFACPDEIFDRKKQILGKKGIKRKRNL